MAPVGNLGLKWIGGVTAVLSLFFGLYQITQLVSDYRERERHVAELYKVGKTQQDAGQYDLAWVSFDQGLKIAESGGQLAKLAGRLSKEQRQLRLAQEDLAMVWLENIRAVAGRQPFTDIVNTLDPVLARGVANASGVRKADLLAHVGWSMFLRTREGSSNLNPEHQYQLALDLDPGNPYVQVNLGHWMLWRGGRLGDATQHFAIATVSGRARDYVRRTQLAALKNSRSAEAEDQFLKVVNDMRKSNEPIDSNTTSDLYSIYYFALDREDRVQSLLAAVPAPEQLATVRALFYAPEFDPTKRPTAEAYVAIFQEATGQREEALRTWQALRSSISPNLYGRVAAVADAAIKRLSATTDRRGRRG